MEGAYSLSGDAHASHHVSSRPRFSADRLCPCGGNADLVGVLHREIAQLTLADDRVHITLEWLTQNDEPLTVTIEHRRDEVHVTLAMTHQYARQVAGLTSNSTVDLFIKVVGSILMEISLDHPNEIAALFHADTHGEGLERIFDVAPPACLWQAALAQAVLGVDDAT